MGHYARLGTLAVRWMAVGFFVLAIVFVTVGFAGAGMMGPMVTYGAQGMVADGMMGQGGLGMLWGPVLLNVVMGALLFATSKRIGSLMGAGLDD